MTRQEKTALFPASFDPVTNGHLDIAHRVRCASSTGWSWPWPSMWRSKGSSRIEERLEMVSHAFRGDPRSRSRLRSFDGLTVDYAQEVGAQAIIRGVRAMSDFEYEFEMALMNKHLFADVETVFMMPSQQYMYVSSSRLKELVRFGRDVEEFVPAEVAKLLRERIGRA